MKDAKGVLETKKEKVLAIWENFYSTLYKSADLTKSDQLFLQDAHEPHLPLVTDDELKLTIKT